MKLHDIVVVGAGPAGLAAAVAASKHGLDCVVVEKGVLVNTIFHFPTNMVFFTTPELLEIGNLPFTTPYEKPTRVEALRYYRRVVDTYDLKICYHEEVVSITPAAGEEHGERVFDIATRSGRGVRRVLHARYVIIATGAFDKANLIGVPGEDLPHVSHYYTEAHPYYRQQVVIVGGQNSAAEAALDLYRAGASVTLIVRKPQLGDSIKYWVKPDLENRIRDGAIRAMFRTRVVEIRPTNVLVEHDGGREEIAADAAFLLTGYHSDTSLLAAAGVEYDPETCTPRFDPDTLETNVPGIFLVGAVTTGRNSGRIFIENGRLHGQQVVDTIARRLASAGVAPEVGSRI